MPRRSRLSLFNEVTVKINELLFTEYNNEHR